MSILDDLKSDEPDDEFADPLPPNTQEAETRPLNAQHCVVDAAVAAALPTDMLTRLRGEESLAVVARVPSAAWVHPVESAMIRLGVTCEFFCRDGSIKSHTPEIGNVDVASRLSRGRSAFGIAPSISLLPRALVASADLTVEIRIDGAILGSAISRYTGTELQVEQAIGLGLDLHDIVAAFRAGSPADEIVDRLRRMAGRLASPRQDRLPQLIDAVEYGNAREWGLALGRDLEDYRAGRLAWSEISGNALFGGAPGVGKTYFGRVLAQHLGIPLIATSISELFAASAGYLDSVIKALREVFARAEAAAPCAILLDELDALPSRDALNDRNASWWTPVIADLLLLLDSASNRRRDGVFVWAATNHPDRIDPALLRPGRLDRVIPFTPPGPAGIASIIRHHLAGDLTDADLTTIGHLGLGRSPAELAMAVRLARQTARDARRNLAYDDLLGALAPRAEIEPAMLRRISLHEAGHAVIAIVLGVDIVVAVDLIGSDGAFGQTVMRRPSGIETRQTIENRVTSQLGGRATEMVFYDGDCSANAGGSVDSDLGRVTEAVTAMRVSHGLNEAGELAYLGGPDRCGTLLQYDPMLRMAVNQDLARLHARAVDIVERHRASIEAVAAALADRRHLTGDEVRRLVEAHPGTPTLA
jgi:hypothetical protein